MKYISTRDRNNVVSATQAITQGLAFDGGLFVPEIIPAVSRQELEHFCSMDYRNLSVEVMGKYLEEFSTDELKNCIGKQTEHHDIANLRVPYSKFLFEVWNKDALEVISHRNNQIHQNQQCDDVFVALL